MKVPIGGTPQMREQCKDTKKVVWREEELVRWHVKTGSGEVEVCVEIENSSTIQNCTNVYEQEERQHRARDRLQPRNPTSPLFPPTQDEPQAACKLERHTKQKRKLNDGMTVKLARNLHESDVPGDASQGSEVVANMKTCKRGDENGRGSVKGAKFHW